MRTAKGPPGIRGRVWAKRWDAVGSPPKLRVVGGAASPGPAPGGARPRERRDYTEADYGHPSCPYSVAGWPLEVRVWPDRPPPGIAAVWHPSGVWVHIRILD